MDEGASIGQSESLTSAGARGPRHAGPVMGEGGRNRVKELTGVASLVAWIASRPDGSGAAAERTLLAIRSAIPFLVGGSWLLQSLPAAAPFSRRSR